LTRLLSALVLLPVVVATIWWLPPLATLVLACLVSGLASYELTSIAERFGLQVSRLLAMLATIAVCAAFGQSATAGTVVLLSLVAVAGVVAISRASTSPGVLSEAAFLVSGALYLGLPIGALVAIRASGGPEHLLLLLFVIMTSDTAQYYGGRAFGSRPLAPLISPKKTVEGAIAGLVGAAIMTAALGRVWLADVPVAWHLTLGVAVSGFGILGDLFESLLKRSANLKDASGLIPGHGGMLDRIDSLLFASPVYYVFLGFLLGPSS
jgi:phosphatidate cytidylyltransferase